MRLALALGTVIVCLACAAAQLTMPEELHNYTHLLKFMTQKIKYRAQTTTKRLHASPGDDEHIEYMFNKYERDFGSQIGSDDYTTPPTQSTSPGQHTPTPKVFTITEIVENAIDETYEPDHHILQLIKELGDKGMRVFSKLKTINEEQKEEHFPWKYMTQHPEYERAATTPISSPAYFKNEEEKMLFKNKTEKAIVQELFRELKSAMDLGEQKKKELLKEKTPTSSESEQMREHYKHTKQWGDPMFDYTTWDGGERHVDLTAASVEREVLPHEKIKKYDTLEVYHEAKAQEEREMFEEYGDTGQTELLSTRLTRPRTTTTTEAVNLDDKVTIPWDAMSNVMHYYISRVTLPAYDEFNHTEPLPHVTPEKSSAKLKNEDQTSGSSSERTRTTTNKLLEDYMKYLTQIGETIEPPTTSFLIERFPNRLSSDEVFKRKFYSKSPHFVEKFARRLDSVEVEKRRSRLSTTPTTSTATWAYTTFQRRTYGSSEREGINRFFALNNISTDPAYFGETVPLQKITEIPILTKKPNVDINKIFISTTDPPMSKEKTRSTMNDIILTDNVRSAVYSRTTHQFRNTDRSHSTTELIETQGSPTLTEFDKEIYNNIDIPIIQDDEKCSTLNKDSHSVKTTRTLSYKELSSVVVYYAEMLRINQNKTLFFETTAPITLDPNNRLTSKKLTTTTTTTTTTTKLLSMTSKATNIQTTTHIVLEDAHLMTEAPLQHVFNLLFDPFRHDEKTEGPSTQKYKDDNYNQFLKSFGSSLYTEPFSNSTDEPLLSHQLQNTLPETTPKVYSKGEVYAMGHRTRDHNHDPLWRSKYGRQQQSTTARKSNLLNVFDDPLGVYLKPDTAEEIERKAKLFNITMFDTEKDIERKAKLSNITIHPYWEDLNKQYFNSTVTVYPWQLTPKNENNTRALPSSAFEKTQNKQEIYSDEHYIEKRATTTPRGYSGYHMPTTEEIPSSQEILRQLRMDDELHPGHLIDKRINDREAESQEKLNEGDMPTDSYMNLTHSDQLCRDRAPMLKLFDDSKDFEDTGFKTLEGYSNETYNLMERVINRQAEEARQKVKERRLNRTREAEERRKTTRKSSEEFKGLRMDNIKFKHLDDDYQVRDEMQEFKKKLKKQFDVIYERSTSTLATSPTTTKLTTTQPMLLITNKDGVVIRRLMKIKRKRLKINKNRNHSMDVPLGVEDKTRKTLSEELCVRPVFKRSVTDAEHFIVVTNPHGKIVRKLKRVKKLKTTVPTVHTSPTIHAVRTIHIVHTESTTAASDTKTPSVVPTSTETVDYKPDSTVKLVTKSTSICCRPNSTVMTSTSDQKTVSVHEKSTVSKTTNRNNDMSTMRSRMIERFGTRHFTLQSKPTEHKSTFFTFETTLDPKYWGSLERKFHQEEEIHVKDRTEYLNPSLEYLMKQLQANWTDVDSNKTITEEEREIDQASEKYYKQQFAGDIDGYQRDYDGNLIPTLSPAEVQKGYEDLEKEKIEFMRKARGEFDKYLSQETYDQMKDKREVRMKHIEEYIDWQYKEEHEKEQERRRKKKLSTETTPLVTNSLAAENRTQALTLRPRIVEKFKERKFTLPFEASVETTMATKVRTKNTLDVKKDTLFTNKTQEIIITPLSSTNIVIKYTTDIFNCNTILINSSNTPYTAHVSQSARPQNTRDNTLVQQVLDYKRFNINYRIKTKGHRLTISVRNHTKTTRKPTTSPFYEYGDYNISTTHDILQSREHGDNLDHLTNVPPQAFEAMKRDEDNLYERYHNEEINLQQLLNMKDKLISKYIVYAKSTTPYTHATFNVSESIFPEIGEIHDHEDVKRIWKKVEAFEHEMATANNTLFSELFSLAFTDFPPTVSRNKPKRYKRMAKNPSTKRTRTFKKQILELNETAVSNLDHTRKSKTKQGKSENSKPKVEKTKSLPRRRRTTEVYNSKKEIKIIQKQLAQLRNDMDQLKTHTSRTTAVDLQDNYEGNSTENHYTDENDTVLAPVSHNNTEFEKKPYMYARLKDNGSIEKYVIQLKSVPFDNEDEKEQVKQQFLKKDEENDLNSAEKRFLLVWKTEKLRNESQEQPENKTDYEMELASVHPFTLVTMVSDLYNKRISLQHHIKYETTTSRPERNRTYLYDLFGFNTRAQRLSTRNASDQFSLFQQYRSTIQHNYRKVSNIQHVLAKYTKNLTIFDKRERRYWDVFFYEKNIPVRQVKWHVGIAPANTRVVVKQRQCCESEYDSEYDSDCSSDYSCLASSAQIDKVRRREQNEFNKFIKERKCIGTTVRPMVFVWQLKSSLPLPTENYPTLMNPDPTATHFRFEMIEPP